MNQIEGISVETLMLANKYTDEHGGGGGGATDAGSVSYDETKTYKTGTVGAELTDQKNAIGELETRLKSGAEEDAELHLGFYLDENGDLCQVEEDENNG